MIQQVLPIVLAFGANLGERRSTLETALAEVAALPGISEFRASSLHETVAVTIHGPDESAPRYLNCVAVATTTLPAEQLLTELQRIEHEHGRVREERWGPRTLDIDIIQYGGKSIRSERLTVPHPRAHEREFVLAPWLEVDPQAVLLGHGAVARLLQRLRAADGDACCGGGCGGVHA